MRSFLSDIAGAMAIETAIVAPVIILLSLGAYQASTLVSRQSELQSAIGVAESVALASVPDTAAERTTLQQIVATTSGLPLDHITVLPAYRCDLTNAMVDQIGSCAAGSRVSYYVKIALTDTYRPVWREFGVGSDIDFHVERVVQYGQATKS
ncbi:hypothetical protein GGQ88_002487 [Novosphingobium hassiacum]|uniref:TadE-like domain-containing protein n=1 Tax=Novosphingobium hassiacum TaxID=173676 RepID=A0A7W6EWP1_9SPHN|nr:TadE/TadG family type IV pilus assembly protein [Novosphingobium hassiacum]MBB3861215.1 hypothetical protein [Novosphingobium hassiacum]